MGLHDWCLAHWPTDCEWKWYIPLLGLSQEIKVNGETTEMYETGCMKGMETAVTTLLKIGNKLEKACRIQWPMTKIRSKVWHSYWSRNQASKASTAPKEGLTSHTNLRCGDSDYARSFYRVKEGTREKNGWRSCSQKLNSQSNQEISLSSCIGAL